MALEDALSEVEYEIESLTTSLNEYDSLISYSTIELTLDEVGTITTPGERDSLGARMAAGVQSSFRGLINGSKELLVMLSYNLVLVLVVVVIAVAVVVILRKKGMISWKRKARATVLELQRYKPRYFGPPGTIRRAIFSPKKGNRG